MIQISGEYCSVFTIIAGLSNSVHDSQFVKRVVKTIRKETNKVLTIPFDRNSTIGILKKIFS